MAQRSNNDYKKSQLDYVKTINKMPLEKKLNIKVTKDECLKK